MPGSTPEICNYEGSDYQRSFWEHGGRAYEDRAEAVALRRLLPQSGKLLLEVGAGAGRNTPRYIGFEQVVLLDYSFTQLQQAQQRLGKDKRYIYVAGNVYALPFVDGLFDAVTMIRVLHHIVDVPLALGQIRRVCQTGAIFILEFANKQNLKAILRYWTRRQRWNPFSLEPVEFVKLNFDFHPKAVHGWLEQSGFRMERQLTVSHFRVNLLKRLVPTSLLVAADSLAQLTGNWWQFTPSVFTRSQAVGEASQKSVQGFFCCPACQSDKLAENPENVRCLNCGRDWPIRDGVYDFRL